MAKKTIKKVGQKYGGTPKADIITVTAKKNTTVSGAGGNDTITVKKGSKHTITGAAGNDKITVSKGSGHKIYGAAGKDKIYIKGSTTSSQIYGDDAKGKVSGSDTITISGGKKNKIYGGKGADTIILNGGSSNTIYGGKGNDVFVIGKDSTGKATVMDLRAGAGNLDKVKISGGAVKNIKASGNDRIITGGQSAQLTLKGAKPYKFIVTDIDGDYTVSSSSIDMTLKKSFTGTYTAPSFVKNIDAGFTTTANDVSVTGNNKDNMIKVTWKDGGSYKGGDGNDTISVTAGNNHHIYGEDESGTSKGDDIITVEGGNGHTIWGQYGNDRITVKNGADHEIEGNVGDDTISVTGGHSHEIKGNDGNDRITLDYVKGSGDDYYSSNTSFVYAGDGNDTITVRNSSNLRVNGEHGSDTIDVSNSSAVLIQSDGDCVKVTVTGCNKGTKINLPTTAGNNVNTVTISGTGNDVTIDQTSGARDIITVNWSNSFGKLNIDASRLGETKYGDTLKINASISNFKFYSDKVSGQDLYIEGKNGGTIFIDGFCYSGSSDKETSFINGISFSDGTFGLARYGNLPEK